MKIRSTGRVPVRNIAAQAAASLVLAACTGGAGTTPGQIDYRKEQG